MKDNTLLLLTAEVVLGGFGVAAMACGNSDLAAVCVGAMAGVVGGHLNGTEAKKNAEEGKADTG